MGEGKKQKLTLSVDATVVEKAKSLGLNISEITESVLRGFTFEPKEGEEEEVRQKYEELFHVMLPLLKKYGTSVEIGQRELRDKDGNFTQMETIYLLSDGHFWFEVFEEELKDVNELELYYLNEPNRILSNLIEAMTKATERNKQSLAELELARRIVEAIGAALSKSDRNPRLPTAKELGFSIKKPSSEKPGEVQKG